MRIRNFLKLVACVLALSLLVAFAINASNIVKPLTQKKVVNPDNLLLADNIVWEVAATKDGITCHRNEDGSWHVYGTSTKSTFFVLTLESFELKPGKTYMFSSGMKYDSANSYSMNIHGSNGNWYVGDLIPDYDGHTEKRVYGAFEAQESVTYVVEFFVGNAGAVIDEVIYPCLVEGTEPGDFYIYK